MLRWMESWLVEMDNGADPIFSFRTKMPRNIPILTPWEAMTLEEREELLAFPLDLDPWLMREKFFKIGNDPADALKFLSEFGVWRFSRGHGDGPSHKFPHSRAIDVDNAEPLTIRFSELIYQRNFFEDALNCKPSDWLYRASVTSGDPDRDAEALSEMMYLYGSSGGSFDMSIVNLQGSIFPGPFKGSVECFEIQDALRATILLDWMEGREWPRCKECRRVFKRTSKHPQFFCCAACASRARQATFRKNRANHRGGKE